MTRLTLLFLIAALVVPGAASALPATDPGTAAPAQSLTAPDRDEATRAALNNGVDLAAADANARATEAYYASYGTVDPPEIAASEPEPITAGRSGPSWFGALGIGVGLILIAGGLGIYAGRTLRPRHLGA